MDTVDRQTRSKIMASVGQKDTGAKLLLRRALHKIGLRYRLHDRSLPGTPDLVLRRFGAVVFVHGCYWHSHGCYKSTVPKSHRAFWTDKFTANGQRDDRNIRLLLEGSSRVLIIWECALLGKKAFPAHEVALRVLAWLRDVNARAEIPAVSDGPDNRNGDDSRNGPE
jgi:DNA mismatch endonuclease (patch repair protein)